MKCLGYPNFELLNSVSTESDTVIGKSSQTWLSIPMCYRDCRHTNRKKRIAWRCSCTCESMRQKPRNHFFSGICFWFDSLVKIVVACLSSCNLSCLDNRVRFYQLACHYSKVSAPSWANHGVCSNDATGTASSCISHTSMFLTEHLKPDSCSAQQCSQQQGLLTQQAAQVGPLCLSIKLPWSPIAVTYARFSSENIDTNEEA